MNKRLIKTVCAVMLGTSCCQAAVDPTRPAGQKTYTQSSAIKSKFLKLQGLVFGEKSWVVINQQLFREGQMKNGIHVIKIQRNRVLVKKNGNKRWLKWQSEMIKKKSNLGFIK